MGKIFISYSHKDCDFKDKVEIHLRILESKGNSLIWSDDQIQPGDDWFKEIENNLDEAKVIIMLISANFLISQFILNEEIPRILERRKDKKASVIPVLLKPCAWEVIPWLSPIQIFPQNGNALSEMTENDLDVVLAELTRIVDESLKSEANTLHEIKDKMENKDRINILPGSYDINIDNLPVTDSVNFVGRDKEIKMIDDAWENKDVKIITFYSMGGVGKTSLINCWLEKISKINFLDAKKIYVWSFYSQGVDEKEKSSSDLFFLKTLQWFKNDSPSTVDLHEKANLLVNLISKQKTLLILDGFETLQYSPYDPNGDDWKIKDKEMLYFLKKLIDSLNGLCIITSRGRISDLDFRKDMVEQILLENLSLPSGIQYLKKFNLLGGEDDFKKVVEEYEGHALALSLLVQYIRTILKGDIKRRSEIPSLFKTRKGGLHAKNVIAAYEKYFEGMLPGNILKIMGLFDRPIDLKVIDSLRNGNAITGITDLLKGASNDPNWSDAITTLRDLGLLGKEKEGADKNKLDCHPLVKQYFRDLVKEKFPEGWREVNKRLYEYYKKIHSEETPNTLEDLEPFYQALTHGTRAGLYKEVLTDIYYKKIRNYIEGFAAYETDLLAIRNFFKTPWNEVVPELNEIDKAKVFSLAAFRLRALGQLSEAVELWQKSYQIYLEQKSLVYSEHENWKKAAINANNLSELKLILGEVKSAIEYGNEGSDYANRIKDKVMKISSFTTHADALHQNGKMDKAEELFCKAEQLQIERFKSKEVNISTLNGVSGFQYCDLLLEKGCIDQVIKRAESTIKNAKDQNLRLEIGLDYLTLGHAWMLKAKNQGMKNIEKAMEYLDQAISNIQASGKQYYVPRCLLARAAFYRLQNNYKKAWIDLSDAKEIIESCDMKLYLCDYHLEAGRLCKAENLLEQSINHFDQAKKLIFKFQYFRRKPEIEKSFIETGKQLLYN